MTRYLKTIIILVLAILFYQCNKEEIVKNQEATLDFSTDSLLFDTVFSSVGSTTKFFKVYNNFSDKLKISSITLAKGDKSNFRINIDGLQKSRFNDIFIAGKDSLYIFVEVTVDPGRDKMLEKDSVVFITNENTQNIKLLAWGQDIHLVIGHEIQQDTTFTNQKPYLIYDSLSIANGHTLNIDAGTKLYFHKNAELIINGTIKVNGELDNPVIFSGTRLEELYDDIPGQWGGIFVNTKTQDNLFNYAEIENATIGIQIGDKKSHTNNPFLEISNCKIKNMTYGGIIATNAQLKMFNTLIANCGYYGFAMQAGGTYNVYHTTIANYYNYATRIEPSLLLENSTSFNTGTISHALTCNFYNCIIYGNNNNEIAIGINDQSTALDYYFDHCLLRLNNPDIDTTKSSDFIHCVYNQAPGFASTVDNLFYLDSTSTSIDRGDYQAALDYPLDLEGNSRTADAKPDIGAYEYNEELFEDE